MSPAPTTPVSCVRAPAASATGVREALLLTGIPDSRPVARLAPPSAMNSRSGSTSSPRRMAKVRDRTLVSVAATSAMPSAAGTTANRSPISSGGRVTGGRPTGSGPTTTIDDREARSNAALTTVAPTTAIEDPRDLRPDGAAAEDDHQADEADGERDRVRLARRGPRPRTPRARRTARSLRPC